MCWQRHAALTGGMTSRRPARTAARGTRSILLVVGFAGLAVLLAHSAFATADHLINDKRRMPVDAGRAGLPTVRWPHHGQASLVLGNGRPAASPHEQPVPIASLAKVMAAYLTLKRYPLTGAQEGFTTTVSAAQAQG